MEYGLRRYEAIQRLLWFLFFLICLTFAYPFSNSYHSSLSEAPLQQPGAEALKTSSFWMGLKWLREDSLLTSVVVYLVWVALLFLIGRFAWLITQSIGSFSVKRLLASTIRSPHTFSKSSFSGLPPNLNRLFPTELLLKRASEIPWRFVFHPYQRLRLMLGSSRGAPASEDLIEKERRIAETDWQILTNTWTPFRWLVWSLPLLGLLQSSWLLHHYLEPVVMGQRDLHDVFGSLMSSLVPIVQMIVVAIALSIFSGLMKRLETLYLSDVDALLYDHFLSQLPFQSSDTIVLLEAMQRQFQELQQSVRRLERTIGATSETKESAGT